jgi:DNA-binding MarR family transcriptional regulator
MARPTKASLAAETWRHIFDFIVGTVEQRSRTLGDFGLTPNDARALGTLEAERGRTMRSFAEAMSCDASTATWIVDRLVAKGLVERRAQPSDRRVTLVALTPAGERTRARVLEAQYTPPAELLLLDRAELVALRDATAGLPRTVRGAPDGSERGGRASD